MIRPIQRLVFERPATASALLAIAGVALWFAVFPFDASVTSDDGAYAIQAINVAVTGEWSVPHVLADVDPNGTAYPFINSAITDEGFFPAGRQAVWVQLLRASYEGFGIVGLRIFPALGLAGAVAAAVRLSWREHGPDWAFVAGLATLSSPLFFNGLQLWAHAPVAAAVALMMLAALHLCEPSSLRLSLFWLAVGGLSGAVAAALRADGMVFAMATVAVVGAGGLRSRSIRQICAAGVLGVAPLAGYIASSLYAESIMGSAAAVRATSSRATGADGGDFLVGRVSGALHTFVSAWGDPAALVLAIVAGALVAAGAWAVRRGDISEGTVLLGTAAAIWVFRIVMYPDETASGLLAAWPIALLALLRPWSRLSVGERRLGCMLGVAAVGILLTQHQDGGSFNWGGRFVASSIPAISVLVVGGLRRLPTADHKSFRNAVAAVAVVVLVASMTFDATVRSRHASHVDVAADLVGAPIVTSVDALPRLAWRLHPKVTWLLLPEENPEVPQARRLRRKLADSGIVEIQLLWVPPSTARELTLDQIKQGVGPEAVSVAVARCAGFEVVERVFPASVICRR